MKAACTLWAAGLVLAMVGAAPAVAQSTTPMYGGESTVEPTPESPWSWIKMPKITMPKITMPKMPADPLAPIKASARKVSDGTKRAWEGTKEMFTFGRGKTAEEPAARVASAEQPSVWSRMFGGAEQEPEPPQTVADWMAQKRVE
jgi:hypothetical protein